MDIEGDVKPFIKCESATQRQKHTVTVDGSDITFNIEVCSLRLKSGRIEQGEQCCSITVTTAEHLLSSLGYNINDIENFTTCDDTVKQEYHVVKVEPVDESETKPHVIKNHNTEIPLQIVTPEIRLVDVRLTHPYLFMEQLNETPDAIDGHDHSDKFKIEVDICKDESTHTGEKPFQCDQCSYRTADAGHLVVHKRIHSGVKLYKCNMCSYRTCDPSVLIRHKRTHRGEKPYKCSTRSYRTSDHSTLTVHKRTHTGEKPYKCGQCSYRTTRSGDLVVHKRIHTGEKPYKCHMCTYKTAYSSHLAVHKRTHTGEKPYMCNVCSYKTAHSGHLMVHTRTHSGEKPYKYV